MKRRFKQQPTGGERVRITDIGGQYAGLLGVVVGPTPSPTVIESHCRVQLDDGRVITGVAWQAGLEPILEGEEGRHADPISR